MDSFPIRYHALQSCLIRAFGKKNKNMNSQIKNEGCLVKIC